MATTAPGRATASCVLKLPEGVELSPGWWNDAEDAEALLSSFPSDFFSLHDVTLVAANDKLDLALVASGSRYFIWNILSDEVFWVHEPNNLAELLKWLAGNINQWGLRTTNLDEFSPSEGHAVSLDVADEVDQGSFVPSVA